MQLTIDKKECIGCGVCMQVCPNIFDLDEEEGKAIIHNEARPETEKKLVKEAIEHCPIGCINE